MNGYFKIFKPPLLQRHQPPQGMECSNHSFLDENTALSQYAGAARGDRHCPLLNQRVFYRDKAGFPARTDMMPKGHEQTR